MFRKLAGLTAVAGLFVSGIASAQIAGTAHDLRTETGANGQICVVCHAPHNTDTSVADAPLWNHAVTTQTFTAYDSATLTAADVAQPAGISKLCLSCHDGVTAIDSFGGATRTNVMTGGSAVGLDLSDDHPISFTYNDTLAAADLELNTPSTATVPVLGGTIQATLLFNDELECGSCHDVHDDTNAPFLRMANTASQLCTTCHAK